MARGETYEMFVDKFKQKKTTDDCYTPPLIYEAVADWVAKQYNLDRAGFVRPFKPGGDYQAEDYSGKIVVDNPPFSILSGIVDWYRWKNVPFFLFSPTLTGLARYSDHCTGLCCGVDVTYANGARVTTSFITNLEPHGIRLRTAPDLAAAVRKADELTRAEQRKKLPVYSYPQSVITCAKLYQFADAGIEFIITREGSARISSLDCQKQSGAAIFGGGFLLSEQLQAEREKAEREKAEREKAEREKAEREKAERWTLSRCEELVVQYLTERSAK